MKIGVVPTSAPTMRGSQPIRASTRATPAAAAGFTQMPFTFVFSGSFSDLYRLFQQLNGATVQTASGGLQVSGRLLTLQGVKLEPKGGAEGNSGLLTGTITATAYVLPSGVGLTGGATAPTPVASAAATSARTRPTTCFTPITATPMPWRSSRSRSRSARSPP